MTTPTIHLNGTSQQDLLDQYTDAMRALQAAQEALPSPHGRDYYPQGEGALARAQAQRLAWAEKINAVLAEVEAVATVIADGGHKS